MAVTESKLNERQIRFINEYVIDMNSAAAAIRAGYSEKTARTIGSRLLTHVDIKAAIQRRMDDMNKRSIMQADEVMSILSQLARGNDTEEQIVVEGVGEGRSKARVATKKMSKADQIKALNVLAKRFGLDQAVREESTAVQIVDDLGGEDGED